VSYLDLKTIKLICQDAREALEYVVELDDAGSKGKAVRSAIGLLLWVARDTAYRELSDLGVSLHEAHRVADVMTLGAEVPR